MHRSVIAAILDCHRSLQGFQLAHPPVHTWCHSQATSPHQGRYPLCILRASPVYDWSIPLRHHLGIARAKESVRAPIVLWRESFEAIRCCSESHLTAMTTLGEQAMIAAPATMACPPHRQLVYEHYTPSLSRSVAFLQSLGFTVLRREAAFAEMGWGPDARLFVEEADVTPAAGYHGNVRVMVPDVDAVYRASVGLPDATILKPLQDRYYGLRDFTVGGPFGMALRFASPLPGFSED